MCLLLIEASPFLRASLAADFRRAGYATEAVDVESAVVSANRSGHRVILLDVELPGRDWHEILRGIREENSDSRIVLLTPRHSVSDCVRGLNSGADDCLPKPFSFDELLARVRALLRGSRRSGTERIEVEDLVIDTVARKVTRAGVAVRLTAREYELLRYLAARPGEPASSSELEDHLHGAGNSLQSNTIASAICMLRRKLALVRDDRPLLHTRRGEGYCLGTGS